MKSCRSCKNWFGVGEHLDREDPNTTNAKVELGECRRYAPQAMLMADAGGAPERAKSLWPLVPSDSWCGEWEPGFD